MAQDPEKLKEALALLKELNDIRRKMNREPLRLTDEDAVKQLKSLPKDIDDARDSLNEMVGSATGLYNSLRDITKEITGQDQSTKKLNTSFRSLVKDAEKLKYDEQEISRLSKKELENLQKRVKENSQIVKEGVKNISNFDSISKKMEAIVKYGEMRGKSQDEINDSILLSLGRNQDLSDSERELLATYFAQGNVLDQLTNKTKERLDFERKIEQKAAGFTTLSKIVSSIPGLSGLAGPFQKAAEAAKEAAREGKGGLGAFAAGGKELLKAFGPLTMAIAAFKFLKDIAFSIDNKQTTIAKSMALSSSEAEYQYKQFKGIKNASDSTFVTTKRLIGAQQELSSTLGATRGFTAQQLEDQVEMTRTMGLQADTAGQLQALSMASSQSADESLSSILDQTVALKMQTGIQLDNKKIIEEVAKTDGQLAANYKNNPGLIAKAVTQVRKLGLSLSKAKDMSSKLLDFESSISAEMEAELLTGRDLNLDRARALALQGDSAGAAAEMLKQVGSLEDFQNMNVIQQQALAAAVGMTSDELANSLTQQSNLNKLGGQTRKELEDRVKKLREAGKIEEANALMSAAGNKEAAEEALRRQSIQDKFQDSMDRLKETFAEIFHENLNISEVANKIVGFFEMLSKSMGVIKVVAAALVGYYTAMAVKAGLTAIANAAAATGAIASASALTLGIGIASIVAGIVAGGVALSKAQASAKKEVKTGNDVAIPAGYGNNMITGPKGSIALNNKDSIIAGTDLFGGKGSSGSTEKLMNKIDRLISIVEKGGNVYIDGNKVGEALVLSSKLSS